MGGAQMGMVVWADGDPQSLLQLFSTLGEKQEATLCSMQGWKIGLGREEEAKQTLASVLPLK